MKWSVWYRVLIGFKAVTWVATFYLVLAVLLWAYWRTRFGHTLYQSHPNLFDGAVGGVIGGAVGAGATVLVVYVAWVQLGNISQVAQNDFLLRQRKEFFTPQVRLLTELIERESLTFVKVNDDDWYFKVDDSRIISCGLPEPLKKRLLQRSFYSTAEVDDELLGHFEDIGLLLERGALDVEMVDETFGTYIEEVWDDAEIHRYIEACHVDDPETWTKFEYLHSECMKYQERKEHRLTPRGAKAAPGKGVDSSPAA
jgi:hypothetical protein